MQLLYNSLEFSYFPVIESQNYNFLYCLPTEENKYSFNLQNLSILIYYLARQLSDTSKTKVCTKCLLHLIVD
jgi:hypothetical protein